MENQNQIEQEEVMTEWDRKTILRAKEIIQNQTQDEVINRGTNNMLFTWVQATRGIVYKTPDDIWEFLASNTTASNMFCVFWENMIEAVREASDEVMEDYKKEMD